MTSIFIAGQGYEVKMGIACQGCSDVGEQRAQIAAKLIDTISVRANLETGQDGIVDLAASPSGYNGSAVYLHTFTLSQEVNWKVALEGDETAASRNAGMWGCR